jgi:hypothetical protein
MTSATGVGWSAANEAVPAVAAKMTVSNNAQFSRINCPRARENGPAARERAPRDQAARPRATIAPSFLIGRIFMGIGSATLRRQLSERAPFPRSYAVWTRLLQTVVQITPKAFFSCLCFSPDGITSLFDMGRMSSLSSTSIAPETLMTMRKHAVLFASCRAACMHLKSEEGLA